MAYERTASEFLEIIAADLRHLQDEMRRELDDHSLRRNSTVLRRLIVDGELQRAWRLAGFEKQPIIPCSTLAQVLKGLRPEEIYFATAGGGTYKGKSIRGAALVPRLLSADEHAQQRRYGMPRVTLPLLDFARATCMILQGRKVTRHRLIKYVANKLGGAHHDTRRGSDEEERLFARLDRAQIEHTLLGRPAAYFELLSIGQALTKSPDIQRFIDSVGGGGAG